MLLLQEATRLPSEFMLISLPNLSETLPPAPSIKERIKIVKEHLDLSIKWKGSKLGILEMRRHYTNYFKGYSGIKKYRIKLVTSDSVNEIHEVLSEIDNHIQC